MICVRCGCEDVRYNRRDRICDPCRKNMAELEAEQEKARALIQSKLDLLRRFEEREPLVRAVMDTVSESFGAARSADHAFKRIDSAVIALRRVMLQHEESQLDPANKTGDKPGASSDDTSEVSENAAESHLSSVVEQRFRKPLETREASKASDEKPGKASDAADGGALGCQCTHEQGDSDCPIHVICCECGADISGQTVVRERARLEAEVRRLREANRVTAENFGRAQLEIAKLQTKLANVEAWYARTTTSDPDELCDAMDELGNTILRDPQPPAALAPKGEPYNGY